MTLGDLELL